MADEFGHGPCEGCHPAGAARAAATAERADTGAWDGPAAMSACSTSDHPAGCFEAICADRRAGDPALQESWALPHHAHPGAPPSHNGVANALARLDSTEGLTNKAAARKHLEAHMSSMGGGQSNSSGSPGEQRAAAFMGARRGADVISERARLAPCRGYFTRETVKVGGMTGKLMEQLDGYASITGIDYDMYDMFGPYTERIDPRAFDQTLAANPDVAFLLNHRGMTMARTTNDTLMLDVDPRGLHARALVNPERSDVHDLLLAIDDGVITEMSFAFMITDGGWSEDYMHFDILSVDIDRGDVSAVNYGANPYTSIAARSRDIMSDVMRLPRAAQQAAYERLGQRLNGAAPRQVQLAAVAVEEPAEGGGSLLEIVPVAGKTGRSTRMLEQLLDC